MKKFKKIFAALAASALVAAMSFTSMAASITINRGQGYDADTNASTEETYTYYKILDAVKTADGTGVAYEIASDSKWRDVLEKSSQLSVKQSVVSDKCVVTWKASSSDESQAIALAEYLNNNIPEGVTGKSLTIGIPEKDLKDGYYLITSSLGTKLILATSDINIAEKNVYPTISKFVDGDKDTAVYSVGDKVPYTIKITVPANVNTKQQITIHDTMAAELKFNKDSLAANGYTYTPNNVSEHGFEIVLNEADLEKAKGKEITFTYTAELLKTPAEPGKLYANTAYLTYSKYVTNKKIANVKTYDFDLKKTQETIDGAVLGGAQFELREDATDPTTAIIFYKDGKDYVKADSIKITEDELLEENEKKCSKIITAGEVNVRGLKNGTYHLVETEAPAGYNILENEVAITITDDGGITAANVNGKTVTVVNKKGILLPSTGGMGTVAFAVVGLIVMAGAAITLIIKKRA